MDVTTSLSVNSTIENAATSVSDEYVDYVFDVYCTNYSDIYQCLPVDEDEKMWVIVTELIIHSVIACFGVVGNILAIIVLHKDTRSSSTNIILKSLAICDTLNLLISVLNNCLRNYVYYFTESPTYDDTIAKAAADVVVYFTLPLGSAATYGSFGLTVMVTVDRYIAVCRPMALRSKKQVYATVLLLAVYFIAYHIPLFFEYKVFTYAGIYRDDFLDYETTPIHRILVVDSLHNNYTYQILYKIIMAVILRDLCPIIMLIAFNARLYRALKAMRMRYLSMRRGSSKAETKRHVSSSESLTKTVVIVVMTFTVLTSPSLLLKTIRTVRQIAIIANNDEVERALAPIAYNQYYGTIGNLLITISSSINFLIYIIFAKKFKKIFIITFCNFASMKTRFEHFLSNSSDAAGPRFASKLGMPETNVLQSGKTAFRGVGKPVNSAVESSDECSEEMKTIKTLHGANSRPNNGFVFNTESSNSST